MDETLKIAIHWIVRAIELGGIAIILAGALAALGRFLVHLRDRDDRKRAVSAFRSNLGLSILLGLEFLVAADIINTVAIEPNLDNLAVLAGIVLIRTFLSFSLEVEIEGCWPWQRSARADRSDSAIRSGS